MMIPWSSTGLGIALATVIAVPVERARAQADRVDSLITAEMKRQNIPGLSLGVMKEGEMIKAQGYGFANIRTGAPVTASTVLKIASVSKQFIAAGIMLLAQDGRLSVDDSISKYLPDVPAAWRPITIRHCLTHTAGLVREGPAFDASRPQTDITVIRSAYRLPLRFQPGAKYEYSNVGYFILGEIITRVSAQPWSEFIDQRVFKPSGMDATYPTNTKAVLPNRAQGYVDNNKLNEAAEWIALRPSGAFLSTVVDMAKWDAVLYTDRVLSAASRQAMWTPVTLNDGTTYPYGFGWQLGSRNGRRMVFHGGGGPGARTKFVRALDDRLSIIVLVNLDDVDIDAITEIVAGHYLPRNDGH